MSFASARLMSMFVIGCLLAAPVTSPPALQTRSAERNGTITGRILQSDGSPASNVRVAALSVRPDLLPEPGVDVIPAVMMSFAASDADGRYLVGVPPGMYVVVAGPLDHPIYFPGVTTQSGARTLTVTAGASLNTGDFRPSRSIRGRVTREGHTVGDRVVLTDEGHSISQTTAIASDGSFEFLNVLLGKYRATMEPGLSCLSPISVLVNTDITDLNIVVPHSAVSDVETLITTTVEGGGPLPQLRLSLEVIDGAQASCSNLRLSLVWLRSKGEPLWVPPDGSELSVASKERIPVGKFRASVVPAGGQFPDGYFLKSIMAGSTDLLTETLLAHDMRVRRYSRPPIAESSAAHVFQPTIRKAFLDS